MEPQALVKTLSYEDLASYTDNFSESNYLGKFQFGKFYRGKIARADSKVQYVLVKVWEDPTIYNHMPGDNERRLTDELVLLPRGHYSVIDHPSMPKLYGCCSEFDQLGIVYDFKPFDSVFNLVLKDDFSWLQRIKVLLQFASLLRYLHSVKSPLCKPFSVRNLDCAHIVLDEDYNPKLCDFGLITGGIFPDRTIYKCHHVIGSYGYIDVNAFYDDHFADNQDVHAFGVILLSLISKRVFMEEDRVKFTPMVDEWARTEFLASDAFEGSVNSDPEIRFERPSLYFSLVHKNLAADPEFNPSDGHKITRLGLECVETRWEMRPTMKQVRRALLKLKVVKRHAEFLGLKNV